MPVEFNEPIPESSRSAASKRPSALSNLLIKAGIVKTERGAQAVFFIIAVLALVGAAFLFTASTKGPPPPTLEQLI